MILKKCYIVMKKVILEKWQSFTYNTFSK